MEYEQRQGDSGRVGAVDFAEHLFIHSKRRTPPIWLMGFGSLPIGLSGGVTLVTVPQLMSAQGSAESAIAMVTTISLVAGFTNFLLAPILDWRLSRRTYAIIMAILSVG